MNHIDNSKSQYQLYGNTVHLTSNEIPQNEKTLLRTLISDMSRSGKFEDAMNLICDTIEEMEKRIKELENK
jgi:hypothetical protein